MPYVLPRPPGKFALPMTPERLTWCLDVLGWSRGELARRLDVSEGTTSQMTTGKRNIPHRLAVWLETLAQMQRALPAPFFWQEGSTSGRQRHLVGGGGQEVDAIEVAWDRPKAPNPVAELLGEREDLMGDRQR